MRQCAFCPSTNLTREHVWADWINGIIPPDTQFTTRRKTTPHGDFTEWKTVGLQQTARVVCAGCNNGWMSDLENKEAKPAMAGMIQYGGAVSLLPKAIASISAWAFKMTVIANAIGGLKDQPYFGTSERYHFAQTLQVPDGVQMWLFSMKTPNRVTGKLNSHLGRLPVSFNYGFELYIATFAIGHLGIQVVASRWKNPHTFTFMGRFPGLTQDHKWSSASIPFFPSDGTPVVWPPRYYLGLDYIDEFCNRWRSVNVPNDWLRRNSDS